MRRMRIKAYDLTVGDRILSGDELNRVVNVTRHGDGSVSLAMVPCDEVCDTYPDDAPFPHYYPPHTPVTILVKG